MADFTLDTSGSVSTGRSFDHAFQPDRYGVCRRCGGEKHPKAGEAAFTIWSDLSPFEQGYTPEVIKAAMLTRPECDGCPGLNPEDPDGPACCQLEGRFDSLAPETLAAIRKDCEAFERARRQRWEELQFAGWPASLTPLDGRDMWLMRQRGILPAFPPRAPSIGDDGKVYLREAT